MSRSRRSRLAICLFATMLVGCAESRVSPADDEADHRASCVALRDHLVELRLGGMDVDREQHREALAQALGDEFLEICGERSEEAVSCALRAADDESAETCLSVAK